ncbi:hypothetical protein FPV67DRAFT_232906 [Lyophyllum atratum]|nr:hypothetical protein FPV67DRAFT_232906 [Lyophyllum atratum]
MDSLPTELLRSIFIQVYFGARQKFRTSPKHSRCPRLHSFARNFKRGCIGDEKAYKSGWRDDHLLGVSSLFPYAAAAVCRRWRDILESIPAFWTRVVAFVDLDPTPLSRIRKQIRLSRGEELEIFVLRRPNTISPVVEFNEHERCRAIIDLIMSQLHRCRSISFRVMKTSSLPSISRDFHGPATALTKLVLRACIDDGRPSGDCGSASLPSSDFQPFHCPNLSEIDIDGRNFAYAYMDLPSWRSHLSPETVFDRNELSLTLSTFHPVLPKDHAFTLDDFLDVMEMLSTPHTLSLDTMEFGCLNLLPLDAFPTIYPYSSSLSGVTSSFMKAFTSRAHFDNVVLLDVDQCGLTGVEVPDVRNVTLQNIGAKEDISAFLSSWEGSFLEIVGCRGFDDRVLRTVGLDLDWRLSLHIEDCWGFSVDGLTEMVRVSGAVDGVRVCGYGPRPPSTTMEQKWLEKHVNRFFWEAMELPKAT